MTLQSHAPEAAVHPESRAKETVMGWVERAQAGTLPAKSSDIYAPSIEVANGIRFSARIGTLTITRQPETDCDGPEWLPEENQWEPCATHGISCPR
jgi:hypothetical protein